MRGFFMPARCCMQTDVARLKGLFAAVRRPDKPCSYSLVSYIKPVNDTRM